MEKRTPKVLPKSISMDCFLLDFRIYRLWDRPWKFSTTASWLHFGRAVYFLLITVSTSSGKLRGSKSFWRSWSYKGLDKPSQTWGIRCRSCLFRSFPFKNPRNVGNVNFGHSISSSSFTLVFPFSQQWRFILSDENSISFSMIKVLYSKKACHVVRH